VAAGQKIRTRRTANLHFLLMMPSKPTPATSNCHRRVRTDGGDLLPGNENSSLYISTNMTTAPFGFGGEDFLMSPLPNYPAERQRLGVLLIGAIVGWIVVVPYVTARFLIARASKKEQGVSASSNNSTTKKSKDKKKGKQDLPPAPQVDETTSFLLSLLPVVSGIMCLVSVCYLVWMSPNNSFVSRVVFEAPLLTPEECQQILDFSYQAAQRNAEGAAENDTALLREPAGWQKTRHSSYPTTDLNLVTDPFSPEAREYISHKLDARLSPLLERIFGVTPRAIRANDMFVVRYDAEERTLLEKHTDDSDISINILLSDEFEGGGTQFWSRLTNRPFAHVKPQKGQVVTHSALIHHEGMPVTKGVRHILVGFLAVDHVDPMTAEPTGLSWFASWLSLPFLHIKFKNGYMASMNRRTRTNISQQRTWTDNKYVLSLFTDLVFYIEYIGDRLAPHFHANLVSSKDTQAYLASMDKAFMTKSDAPVASWFRGQQLDRDVNGKMTDEWDTRKDHEESFQDL